MQSLTRHTVRCSKTRSCLEFFFLVKQCFVVPSFRNDRKNIQTDRIIVGIFAVKSCSQQQPALQKKKKLPCQLCSSSAGSKRRPIRRASYSWRRLSVISLHVAPLPVIPARARWPSEHRRTTCHAKRGLAGDSDSELLQFVSSSVIIFFSHGPITVRSPSFLLVVEMDGPAP
jgi:hypothetical protein